MFVLRVELYVHAENSMDEGLAQHWKPSWGPKEATHSGLWVSGFSSDRAELFFTINAKCCTHTSLFSSKYKVYVSASCFNILEDSGTTASIYSIPEPTIESGQSIETLTIVVDLVLSAIESDQLETLGIETRVVQRNKLTHTERHQWQQARQYFS